MQVAAIPPLPETIYRKNEVIIMEFANSVVNLIGNIICLGILVTFLIGLIYGIKFMIQAKTQDKEEYERKKAKDELDYKETELRYKKLLEDKR
jgi:5-bromo-4-chloroindolyl phosphate hydrolysis protein